MFSSNKQGTVHESKDERQLISVKKKIAAPVHFPNGWSCDATSLITPYILEDSHNLETTCRFFFSPSMQPIFEQRKLDKLAYHVVVKPNENQMIVMLNRQPTLVNELIKQVVVGENDFKRILLNNTIFQLAFGAGDHDMCLAMRPFFVKVYGSEQAAIQEMDRQRNEKFAEDKEEDKRKDKQAEVDLEALIKPVIEAITDEGFNSGRDVIRKLKLSTATLSAINTFRTKFADSQPKIIERGLHFRDNTLPETFGFYTEAAKLWEYNYNKCALFMDGILSWVLLYVPRNVSQKFSQGLYYLQKYKAEKFTRQETLRNNIDNFYQSALGPSFDFSLDGCCIDILFGGSRGGRSGWAVAPQPWERLRVVSRFISRKNIKLAELIQPEPQPKFRCVIC